MQTSPKRLASITSADLERPPVAYEGVDEHLNDLVQDRLARAFLDVSDTFMDQVHVVSAA